MKVKIFDENHELDLEKSINEFLEENKVEVIDIKYQVALSIFSEEQIYCFSAMIIYNQKNYNFSNFLYKKLEIVKFINR